MGSEKQTKETKQQQKGTLFGVDDKGNPPPKGDKEATQGPGVRRPCKVGSGCFGAWAWQVSPDARPLGPNLGAGIFGRVLVGHPQSTLLPPSPKPIQKEIVRAALL